MYDIIIGLEIHAELDTKSKAFCSCRNEFGAMPNTQVCPVCLGLPGAMPVLNKKAVEYTIMGGLSFGCDINHKAVFERKNYFYPDLSKSYQITQLDNPLCTNGGITLDNGKFIKFNRIHLEEDAGKLIHTDNETLIDYNRSGIPLIEMVTEPQECTPADVVEFINKLRSTLIYAGISKCKMEEGGLRFDINISVRPKGVDTLGTRCEMKNLNSLKSLEKAIEYESNRQIEILDKGGVVIQETRGWNEEENVSYTMRKKENVNDYRYFPDPDIIPIEITQNDIVRLKRRLPELIDSKKQRLISQGLPESDVNIILREKSLADYFTKVNNLTNKPKETANWIVQEVLRVAKENSKLELEEIISSKDLSLIINKVEEGSITRINGRLLMEEIIKTGKDAENLIFELNLEGDVNKNDVVEICRIIISERPEIIDDYHNSPDDVINYFIGFIMKHTQGKAKPEYVIPLIKQIISKYEQN